MFYWGDWTFVLMIPALLLSLYAQTKVSSTFAKYEKIRNTKGLTGKDVAQFLLQANNITDVTVEHTRGKLTDHYDPRSMVIRLSDSVYNSTSIAAISVAAHETGHAIQHNVGYAPLKMRHSIFPVVQFSSALAMPIFFAGLFFGTTTGFLLNLGILLFCFVVVFQVVTLPVEFNASDRALKILRKSNILSEDEIVPARKVLTAAALTYVAAAVSTIIQLVRLLIIADRD